MGTELRRLKPETITRALLALRAELIREGGPGLAHVEALLQLRGNNLPPVPRKAKPPHFRRGKLRAAIYAALRDGPITGPEIVRRVAEAHGLPYRAIYRSVYAQLHCIKKAGLVVLEERLWLAHCGGASLAPPPGASLVTPKNVPASEGTLKNVSQGGAEPSLMRDCGAGRSERTGVAGEIEPRRVGCLQGVGWGAARSTSPAGRSMTAAVTPSKCAMTVKLE